MVPPETGDLLVGVGSQSTIAVVVVIGLLYLPKHIDCQYFIANCAYWVKQFYSKGHESAFQKRFAPRQNEELLSMRMISQSNFDYSAASL